MKIKIKLTIAFILIVISILLIIPNCLAFKGTSSSYEAGRTSQGVAGNTGTSNSFGMRFTGTANQPGNLYSFTTLYNLIVGWFGMLSPNTAPVQETPTAGAHHQTKGYTYDENLISYWQFEHGSNKTATAIDSVGTNNGTLNGSVVFTDEGAIGSAYIFDGTNFISVPYDSSLNPGADLTLSAWVYWTGKAGDNNILTKEGSYEFRVNNGYIAYATNPWAWRGGTSAKITQNNWHHVVITHDGDGLQKIYIDGLQNYSDTSGGSISSNTNIVTIGRRQLSGGISYFNGTIDQVMLFNRALTPKEVYDMYLDGRINSSSEVTTEQDLGASAVNQSDNDEDNIKNIFNWYKNETSITVLNMPFEGGSISGTAAGVANGTKDYSSFGNNGTVYNATWNSTGGIDGKGAYEFDGTGNNAGFISTADFSWNQTVNPYFTISVWAKPYSLYSSLSYEASSILGKFTGYEWSLQRFNADADGTGDDVTFRYWNTSGVSGITVSAIDAFTENQWTHIAVVGDFTKPRIDIYVNGTHKANASAIRGTLRSTADYMDIGRASFYGYFNGSIDEVHIFNRSLSAEQVKALYNLEHNRIAANETSVNEVWKCCITPNDGTTDGTENCTNNITIKNGKPSIPVLIKPINSSTITNRTPEFLWNNSVDPDGDTLTYDLLVSDESAFAAPIINITNLAEGTTNTSHVNDTELDLDTEFFWKVRAFDGTQYSDWSAIFNFTLESYLAVSLIVNSTDFGNMEPYDTNDTSDDDPNPLVMENLGNLGANVTITGTQLFTLGGFPSEYYQFKIGINETDSFDTTKSTMNYTNMTSTSSNIDTAELDWHNLNDTAELDINVTVPATEPTGTKNSIITITVSAS